jgi:hypothetical protein
MKQNNMFLHYYKLILNLKEWLYLINLTCPQLTVPADYAARRVGSPAAVRGGV